MGPIYWGGGNLISTSNPLNLRLEKNNISLSFSHIACNRNIAKKQDIHTNTPKLVLPQRVWRVHAMGTLQPVAGTPKTSKKHLKTLCGNQIKLLKLQKCIRISKINSFRPSRGRSRGGWALRVPSRSPGAGRSPGVLFTSPQLSPLWST